MNAVFVDSSVWIDHFRGIATSEVGALRRLLVALDPDAGEDDPAHILVGDLVLLEVLRGIVDDRQHDRTRAVLLAFPQVAIGGTETALAAADHYRALRRRGVSVRKAVDCLIAAWCIARSVPLLHGDRDFEPFAEHCGLRRFELEPSP
ncbi:MAG: PIN domain nuclease [Acetobacteraceae bacterium]|nr:PIN domain nuclease [Acetobacteraceae bacterium]